MTLVFGLFTAVQYNDPDPVQWMLLYGGVTVLFAMAARGKSYRPAIWIWLIAALAWAGFLAPDFWNWIQMGEPSIVGSMKAETPYIELTREFLGLLIAAAGCGWLLLWKK